MDLGVGEPLVLVHQVVLAAVACRQAEQLADVGRRGVEDPHRHPADLDGGHGERRGRQIGHRRGHRITRCVGHRSILAARPELS
jgi:hypothetical protein